MASLSIGLAHLGTDGTRALIATPLFRRGLLELGLKYNDLTDSDVEELVSAPGAERLVALDLSDNELTATGARSLAAATRLCGLRRLDVSHNPIGRDGLAILRERFGPAVEFRPSLFRPLE